MQAVGPSPWQPIFLLISRPLLQAKRLQRQLTLLGSHEDPRHGLTDIFGFRFLHTSRPCHLFLQDTSITVPCQARDLPSARMQQVPMHSCSLKLMIALCGCQLMRQVERSCPRVRHHAMPRLRLSPAHQLWQTTLPTPCQTISSSSQLIR